MGDLVLESAQQLGLSLDEDPPPGVEETPHNNHRSRRKGIAQTLAVGTTDPLPVGGIDNIDSRPHHVFTGPAEGFDSLEDDLETAGGLHIGVALHGLTLLVDRRRARDGNP